MPNLTATKAGSHSRILRSNMDSSRASAADEPTGKYTPSFSFDCINIAIDTDRISRRSIKRRRVMMSKDEGSGDGQAKNRQGGADDAQVHFGELG